MQLIYCRPNAKTCLTPHSRKKKQVRATHLNLVVSRHFLIQRS